MQKPKLFTDERSQYVNAMFQKALNRPATPQELSRYRLMGTVALEGIIETIKYTQVEANAEQKFVSRAASLAKKDGVSLVGPYNTQCGISTYTENLFSAIRRLGFRCCVLADEDRNRHGSEEDERDVFRCWNRNNHNSYYGMAEKAMQMENKVVHICSHEYGIYDNNFIQSAIRLLKLCGFKVSVTLHTVLDQRVFDWVYEYADVLIVHSEMAAHRLYGAGINNITVIQHGTEDPLIISKDISRKFLGEFLQINPGDIVATSPGFISPNKAIENSLKAVVMANVPNLKYLVIGSTSRRPSDTDQLEKLREYESDNIKVVQRFLTKREMAMIMTASDFCIFNYEPTHHSISGMSHEAMSYGVPTISSTSKILTDLGPSMSLKVPHDRIKDIAEAITTMAKDELMRKCFREAALAEGKKTSWQNMARYHLNVYQTLMRQS